jgi:threonine/homoserine/homoserine lactone efflux protein
LGSVRVVLIDPHRVATLFVVALMITAVPGPTVLFVVSRGVALGRAAALATVIGNELGLMIQVSAIAVGLGSIVERSIVVYSAIKLLGAAYLVYLGVQSFRHRGELAATIGRGPAPMPGRRIVWQGMLVGVSNPKAFLLFAAILPQFTDPAAGHLPLQMFLLGVVCVLIALASDTVWALIAGTARAWFEHSPRRLRGIGAGAGAVMVGLGLRIALSGRAD